MKEEIFNLLGYANLQDLRDIKKEVERLISLKLKQKELIASLWPNSKSSKS